MANKELSFNLPIGSTYTGAVADQEVASELTKLYNAVNLIAAKLDEYTGAIPEQLPIRPYISPVAANKEAKISRIYAEATVDMVKGTIAVLNSSGKLVKGSAALGAQFIILDDVSTGNYAEAAVHGVVDGFAGLIPGTHYVASNVTAGAIAISVPAGNIRRYVGFAITPTTLMFNPDNIGVTV